VAAWVVPQRSNGEIQYGVKVVDQEGFVLLELDGYRTSPLPTVLPQDIRNQLMPGTKRS
jgi:hypothetical protein